MGRSSEKYDILSHLPHIHQGAKTLSIYDNYVTNRRKGVTEFADLQSLASLHHNLDH